MIKGHGMPQHKGMACRCGLVSTKILVQQLLALAMPMYGNEGFEFEMAAVHNACSQTSPTSFVMGGVLTGSSGIL